MKSVGHSIKNTPVGQWKKLPISGQTSIALFWVERMKHAGSSRFLHDGSNVGSSIMQANSSRLNLIEENFRFVRWVSRQTADADGWAQQS
jgi:adenylylsulfate kinase-like enzyme